MEGATVAAGLGVPVGEAVALRDAGMELGFLHVEAGPLVRSSYHAEQHRPQLSSAPDASGTG